MYFTGERRVVYRIAKGALVLLFATVILGESTLGPHVHAQSRLLK